MTSDSSEGAMSYRYVDSELTAELLERRWFAAQRAAKSVQAECDGLLEVLELAEDAWRRSRAQLVELETLRDALGDRLAAIHGSRGAPPETAESEMMSAA
jgi:hypothetical protein